MADVTSPFGFPYPEDTDLVRDGANDIENLAEGVNDYLAGGYLYAGTRYYTSSGTFAKADPLGTGDIGLRAIKVTCVGGGGGGGGCATTGAGQAAMAGGGTGGGAGISFILASSLSASETVTRGSGGAGGAAGANNGVNGADSVFAPGETYAVEGGGGRVGGGGEALTPPAIRGTNPGSTTSVGDVVISGLRREPRYYIAADVVATLAGGWNPLFGGNQGYNQTNTGANGPNGVSVGEGGGGGANTASQATARSGGTGTNGIVIVDCFV
jgi:hypothetical protein